MKHPWALKKIGDLCSVGRGSSPRPINDRTYFEGGTIPWIRVADATASQRKVFETREYVNEYGASFSRLLPAGSLIICTSGTLGYPVFLGVDGCIHDGWLYTYDYNGLDKEFLYYKLIELKNYFVSAAYGSAIQNINTEILRNTEIQLPPLETQRLIADILTSYDDLIENNRRRIDLLEQSARLLYKEWFVSLRFPGHEHVQVKDGVPKGWRRASLAMVADVNRASLRSNHQGDIEYIDIASVSTGTIEEITPYRFEDAPGRARRIVKHGDIIWSCVRPNRKSYSVIWNPADNLIASTGFAVLSPTEVPTSFLLQATTTDEFVGYLSNNARGAAYPAVTGRDFEKAVILIPTKTLLQQYDEVIEPLLSQIHTLQLQNQKLKQARDLLLPRLMNGEIPV